MYRLLCTMLSLLLIAGCGRKTTRITPRPDTQQASQRLEREVRESKVRKLGGGWVEAVGEAYLVNITPEQAEKQALEDAREQAIMCAVGVKLQSEILDIQRAYISGDTRATHQSFTDISQHTSSGKIVEEKQPPEWETYLMDNPAGGPRITVYRCTLQAKVEKEKGWIDPDFQMSLALNKLIFRDGDEVTMKISATKDCYLTVLNITANDTVLVLLPHQYRADNFIKAGEATVLPNEEERTIGIHYRAHLPEGVEQTTEFIKVIATKKPYHLGLDWEQVRGLNFVPTSRAALSSLYRWLVRIPLNERAEAQAIYEIRKKL